MFTLNFFKENSSPIPFDKEPYWTLLGDAVDLRKILPHHREQLFFLNKKAADFIYTYIDELQVLDKQLWQPFKNHDFKLKEKYQTNSDFQSYKKWLYQRGIAFSNWVLVLPNYNSHPMLMTWKMVLKYTSDIFGTSDDILIFDFSQSWYLFHYHEGETTLIKR